jgi:N-acetylmuramoyl-L-alanine amidase
MKIKNHLLINNKNNITYLNCTKNYKKFESNNLDTIVIHFTAGSSSKTSAYYLTKPDLAASAHIVIGRDGLIYQLVPFDTIAWHAGKSYYNGRTKLNNYSIGIELDNPGELIKIDDTYQSYFGNTYNESEVICAAHKNDNLHKERYWLKYTDKQLKVCEDICKLLINEYNITTIVGHDDIAPDRKIDPGPAFPMKDFKHKLLNKNLSHLHSDIGIINTTFSNIYSGPNKTYSDITEPLVMGTKVKILEEFGLWYKIEVPIIGWVNKKNVVLE